TPTSARRRGARVAHRRRRRRRDRERRRARSFSSSGLAVAGAALHASPPPVEAQRQLAASRLGVFAEDLVPARPRLAEVGGPEREAHALLLPAREVDREGDPPEVAVAPEMVIGV